MDTNSVSVVLGGDVLEGVGGGGGDEDSILRVGIGGDVLEGVGVRIVKIKTMIVVIIYCYAGECVVVCCVGVRIAVEVDSVVVVTGVDFQEGRVVCIVKEESVVFVLGGALDCYVGQV